MALPPHGESRPDIAGLSVDRLAAVDHFLQTRYLDTGRLKGCVTLIARRGEIAHHSALGLMDAERGRPMCVDTLFRIYSMTKPLTSLAFMMLVEQGLVALDDPVSRYIPQWSKLGVFDGGLIGAFRAKPVDRPMRIIDLLRHTSGLTYGFQQRTNVDAAYRRLGLGEIELSGTLDALIDALADLPLEFSPGEAWNYSISTDVIGYLIGQISGQPFEDFLRTRLLAPLGMVDTDFFVPPHKADRLAACYALTPDGVAVQDDPTSSPYLAPPSFVSGGGGLVSTAADYMRFCQMILNRGALDGRRYVSPKTLELMAANHLPGAGDLASLSRSMFSEASYAGIGFGLGFATTIDAPATLIPGSRGDLFWGGAASTSFWIDPAEALSVVFLTQLLPSSAYPIRRELRTLVYSAFTD